MHLKNYTLLFFINIFSSGLFAQQITLDWNQHHAAKSAYGAVSRGASIAQVDSNYIYLVGAYRDTVDFDPGAGSAVFSSTADEDIYIQKFHKDGTMVWTRVLSGTGREAVPGFHVASDGSLYLTGSFIGTVDFDPGAGVVSKPGIPGTTNPSGSSGLSLFLLKLDSAGVFQWVHAFGEGTSFEGMRAVETDAQGNVYCSATVHQRTGTNHKFALDPTQVINDSLAHFGRTNIVYKFDSQGNYLWSRVLQGTSMRVLAPKVEVEDLILDNNGNIITVGIFREEVDFDPSAGFDLVTGLGTNSIYINKLDSSGNYLWTKTIDAPASATSINLPHSVVCDAQNNIYLSGYVRDTLDMDPGNGVQMINAAGSPKGFLLKLNANGDYLYHHEMQGSSSNYSKAMEVDGQDNLWLVGNFYDTLDLPSTVGSSQQLVSNGYSDAFLAKYDNQGNLLKVFSWGGVSFEDATSLSVKQGALYIAGTFRDTVDFDPVQGQQANYIAVGGGFNTFLAKYGVSNPISTTSKLKEPSVLSVYPNPTKGVFKVRFDSKNTAKLDVFDLEGKVILSKSTYSSEDEISLSSVPAGIYFVRLQIDNLTMIERVIVH